MTAVINDSARQTALAHFLKLCQIKTYPAKTILVHSGQINENLFYIIEGSVAVIADDEHGKGLVLAYLNKGDFIGEIGVFSGKEVRIVKALLHKSNLFQASPTPKQFYAIATVMGVPR